MGRKNAKQFYHDHDEQIMEPNQLWYGSMFGILWISIRGADVKLCDKDTPTKYTPILTSADWLEPVPGRCCSYMCYDYMDEGSPYSILAMSIGNPPCSGPEPGPTPAPAPSGVGKAFDVSWHWLCLHGGVVAALALA
eukprot:scaffold33074_cov126-Skeletonema_dohrnii-CCMP3373.AAC.2